MTLVAAAGGGGLRGRGWKKREAATQILLPAGQWVRKQDLHYGTCSPWMTLYSIRFHKSDVVAFASE